jgi:ABC-type nitrate/sulfonate/bicarbonate transport system ATPase subunit
VSIARALAPGPELLIMDEPFKAMDEALRDRILRVTADALGDAALMLITHSEREALTLGCRVLRYRDGCFV